MLAVTAGAILAWRLPSSGGGRAASSGACAASLRFRGVDYLGYTVHRHLVLSRPLGQATFPPCVDSPDSRIEPVEGGTSEVLAIAGVPPAVAIASADDPSTPYLAEGFFPELPSHPLHEGGPGVPDATDGCRTTGAFTLAGAVVEHGAALLVRVTSAGGFEPGTEPIHLLVDTHTRVEGFEREGLAYVAAGDSLRAEGVTCSFAGTREPALVARLIVPAR